MKTALYSKVYVASKLLSKDIPISEKDLELRRQDKTLLHHGFYVDASEIVGKIPKKPIQSGSLLTPDLLQVSQVIKRGDMVTIIVSLGGLTVKSQGQAMESGVVGDVIKVKNDQSKRVIEGVVASAGVIKIPL